jgi:alpha-ketoglutarate-dependent taurine dioxygenase
MFEVTDLKPQIGSTIRTDPATLLQPETAGEVRRLLVARGVLVFKRLDISDADQVALAGRLGSLREQGEGNIFKIGYDPAVHKRPEYVKGTFLWHMDGTEDDVPVFASLLSGRRLSAVGGQTEFANSYAAYEALPAEMKRRIEGLKVVHSVETSMRRADILTEENFGHWSAIPHKVHNLVWTHQSGRKSLVIGCHASHVVAMDRAESDALIDELLEWTTQPRFVYRHQWDVGDMLIWDNTGVIHRAEPYPLDSQRVMHRTTLLGEEAFA